jgi:hypothetical protein
MVKLMSMSAQIPEQPIANDWGDGTPLPEIKPPDWSHLSEPPGPCRNTPCDLTIYDEGKTGEVAKED